MGVSAGVAVGQVLLFETEALPVVPVPIPPERVEEEIERFLAAREKARIELQEVRERTKEALGETYARMLDAQLLILDDPALIQDTHQRIRLGRVYAGWALKEVVGEFIRRFEMVDQGYFRERGGDLEDVHRRLQRLLRGGPSSPDELPEGPLVLVAHALGPSDAASIPLENVVGIATDMGGRTSHTAILAQALGLPGVVGLHDFSQRVRPGDPIVIDGESGDVVWLPSEDELKKAEARREDWLARERVVAPVEDRPAETRDGIAVEVRANIEFPDEVDKVVRFGARGVGLYRSEFLFLAHTPHFPDEQDHLRTYLAIAEQVQPHPVVIRTLDLGGEKYFHEVLDHSETNPVLGLRGIRLCLKRPDIFLPQLRGLLRAAAHANVRMMLPLVTVPEEIREVRRLLAQEAEKLRDEGKVCREDLPLGIMVEVPAAAAAADLLSRDVDFFSIGTNDLVQYALAVDRSNESVAYLAQPLHPAVLRLIRFVIDSARMRDIPVALCGEMAADPEFTALLIGLGLRELSVPPRLVPLIRETVARLDLDSATRLADEALMSSDHAEVVIDPLGESSA
jgi:phosphotransferase system enzyme I (PtsI)